MRVWVAIAFLYAAAGADDRGKIEELEKRNAALEERVRVLERTALEESIEEYLAESRAELEGEGASSLLPGGLAVRLSGEIRIRGEVHNHLYSPVNPEGRESFDFVHMRTRLRFDVDVDENLSVVIELQDVRAFGDEGSTVADDEGVGIKRAYIYFEEIFGKPLDVEVGRYVMHYGDQRIIGHLEWVDQGRSYDGIRVLHEHEGRFLDFFAVKVRETFAAADDQHFLGLYGGLRREKVTFEGYAIWFADQLEAMGEVVTDDTSFWTLGVRVAGSLGRFGYTVEAAVQTGEVNGDDLEAWGIVGRGTYTFEDTAWKWTALIEIVFATGNEALGDGETEQFQVLFPTNHMHYGYADLVAWSNIFNIRAGVAAHPAEAWKVALDFHYFELDEATGGWVNAGGATIRPGVAGADTDLGTEIDLTVSYEPTKKLSLLFGWSIFFPGGFVEETGASPTAQLVYLQVHTRF